MVEVVDASAPKKKPKQDTGLYMTVPLPTDTPLTTLEAMQKRGDTIESRDGQPVVVKTLVPEGGLNPFVPKPADASSAPLPTSPKK